MFFLESRSAHRSFGVTRSNSKSLPTTTFLNPQPPDPGHNFDLCWELIVLVIVHCDGSWLSYYVQYRWAVKYVLVGYPCESKSVALASVFGGLILPLQPQTNSYLKQLTFINVESQQATDLLHALHTSSLDRHATDGQSNKYADFPNFPVVPFNCTFACMLDGKDRHEQTMENISRRHLCPRYGSLVLPPI